MNELTPRTPDKSPVVPGTDSDTFAPTDADRGPLGPNLIKPRADAAIVVALLCMVGCFGLIYFQQFEAAAIACAASGLSCGLTIKDAMRSQPLFVQIVLGLMMAGCAFTGWICFTSNSFAVLFPGFPTAFAAGQMAGMFLAMFKSRGRTDEV